MTLHVPYSSRMVRPVVIRNASDLQAYLTAKPAPQPAVVRVDIYARIDRALRSVVLGK